MSSKIKVDNIADQGNNNMLVKCGSTLTIGATGNTITLASGATQSGFGRSGSVNWQTTIKTGDFSAVNGEGYFVDTTSGGITMTLPSSPSVGDIVSFKDYARTFDSQNLTANRGGSNMDGVAENTIFSTQGLSGTLIYMDATKGWSLINDDATTRVGAAFIAATGGTITQCGNFKIHTFTGPGTFTVCSVGNSAGSNTVSYTVVAGGGGAGHSYPSSNAGGGGGAGGYREGLGSNDSYSGSPLRNPTGVPVTAQGYPITVGAGGSGSNPSTTGADGSDSIFSTITSAGGGKGGHNGPGVPISPANTGGSGGGGGGGTGTPGGHGCGKAGNTPPVSPPQGNAGASNYKIASGNPPDNPGAGGGGAGAAASAVPSGTVGGDGGAGTTSSINGSPTTRAGGGAGGGSPNGTGGTGGGGGTGQLNATVNTGGGGGGTMNGSDGGNGASGIVIIRYKFQ